MKGVFWFLEIRINEYAQYAGKSYLQMTLSESKQIKYGAILAYAQIGVHILISLIYTPVMITMLGKTEYGLYNIATTTISYVNLLNMGFSNSYVRFYARCNSGSDKQDLARLNGLFCMVFFIIGAMALIAGFILSMSSRLIFGNGLTDDEYEILRIIIFILAVSTSYNLTTSIFSSIIVAHERFVFHKLVNLIKTILGPSLIWMLLLWGYRSIMMAFVSAVLTVVVDTYYVLYCLRKLKIKISFRNPSKKKLKEIMTFSSFIATIIIADQINWSIDKILLGRFWGAAYTAVYSVAALFNNLYMQLSTAISNVFIPKVNKMVADNRSNSEITNIFIKVGRLQFMVLAPIITGFIIFGRIFIRLWTPEGYDDAYIIALLLMVPATIPFMQNIGIAIQTAKNKHQFRSILYTGMAITNLVISIFLCKPYGGVGCAVGTAISLVFADAIVMNIYYHKEIGINIIEFWNSILKFIPAVILTMIIGVIIKSTVNISNWLEMITWLTVYTLVYIAFVWLLGMNEEEKKIITSVFQTN